MSKVVAHPALLLLLSCAGRPPGTAMGTVAGTALMLREAHFVSVDGVPTGSGARVFLTDYPGACTAAASPLMLKGITLLDVVMVELDGGLVAGDYAVGGPAEAHFSKLDNACLDTLSATATAGVIHLSVASATQVNGSFDLELQAGHLAGDFQAVSCTPPSPNGSSCN